MTHPATNGASHGEPTVEHDEPRAGPGSKNAGDVWRFVRKLPGAAQAQMKTNPAAVVAGVGATAFVLGALCGSRVGRVLVTTLAGYGLRRLIEGPVASDAMKHAGASA